MLNRKKVLKQARELTKVCDLLLHDGLQRAPTALRKLSDLKLVTYGWRLDAELTVEATRGRLFGSLREALTQKGKVTEAGLKAAVEGHDDYIAVVKLFNRMKTIDSYVGDCIDDVNQKLSAMKAQTEILRVEANAAIDPRPMKGHKS